MSESKSGVAKALDAIQRDLELKVGETAVDLWRLYEAMRPEDRKALKEWADSVAPFAHTMSPCNLHASLEVTLCYPTGPDEDIRINSVPVGVVRWVMEGWERHEKPAPPTLRDLGLNL